MRPAIGMAVLLAVIVPSTPLAAPRAAAQPAVAPPPRLALPPVGRASAAGAALRDLGYVEVPFHRLAASDGSGILIVQARVNDRPVRLLLDTGAAHTCLDREWAKSAGLTVEATQGKASGLGSSDVVIGRTEKVEFSIGAQSAPAVLGVIDFSHLNTGLARDGMPTIDGLLGDSTLQFFAAVIDYPGTRLYLLPPALQTPTELAGAWRGVREERDGKRVDPPSSWFVEFSNGQVRLTQDAVTIAFRPAFGSSAGTKSVTLEAVINRRSVAYPGIYAVKDGRLLLCLRIDAAGGDSRPPRGFATKAGDGCVLIELERDTPDP